ncbi:MAG: DNA primase [Alphaproteobacteria bacterium]|nr:DNA primase [Alphaproteobacteria bacterium]
MRYGQGLLEEVLRRTDLVQLVGRRVKLVRKGRVMWGCCPFHQEKSPSFKVENERRTYKCFGCGAGGDAFKWLMETEGLSFPEAVERLAGEAGVELPKWSAEDEAREQKKKSLYEVIEAACEFFEAQLRAPGGKAGRDYLKSRGLDDASARQFRLGYAPGGNSALIEHLKARNVTVDDMIAAGLARPADETRGARDFFFNRITFPISDARGRLIAFGARALEADAKPKYINTGETGLFSKGHNLYNFASARPAALKAGTIILAEGYMDVIALVRAGFAQAVAPLGTALTEDQLGLLWRVAPEPILAFDGDEAGLRAGTRAAHLALPHLKPGHSLRFAFLPPGEDPDTLIRREGAGAMQKLLDAAQPLAEVLWRSETEGKDFSTPERRAGLERALADLVGRIADTTIADYYRRDFNERVFEAFKRRQQRSSPGRGGAYSPSRRDRPAWKGREQPYIQQGNVSLAVKQGKLKFPPVPREQVERERGGGVIERFRAERASALAACRVKEEEIAGLLLEVPELAAAHAETLAALVFSDPQLDRLRRELLNLAASGSRLENRGLKTHLQRSGMAELVQRLQARHGSSQIAAADRTQEGTTDGEDIEARWLGAVAQLREMAQRAP